MRSRTGSADSSSSCAVLAVIVSQARTPQSANGDFVGHFLSISSRTYVASRMAVSTVAIFFGLGLSGFSSSASFRADKIVAANRIANFHSSVTLEIPNVVCRRRAYSLPQTFRACALASNTGTVALARAFRELFEKSGEKPRAELFDGELFQALNTRLPDLSNDDRVIVQWVIGSIR